MTQEAKPALTEAQSPAAATAPEFFTQDFEGSPVRMARVTDGVLFCAADVAKVLGYSKPADAVSNNCSPKGVQQLWTPTKGGVQQLKFLKRGAVNELILASRRPEAQRFKEWVCYEVLPQIEANGSYQAIPRPPISERASLATAEAVNKIVSTNRDLADQNKALVDQVIKLSNRIADVTRSLPDVSEAPKEPKQPKAAKPPRLTRFRKGTYVIQKLSGRFNKHQFADRVNKEYPGTYTGKRKAHLAYATLHELEQKGLVDKVEQGGILGKPNVWKRAGA